MITLRQHQIEAIADVDDRRGKLNTLGMIIKCILCVLPTGSGKSLTLAEYARRYLNQGEITVVLAHRDVLISQLSEALCKTGVPHTFICSDKARRDITNRNLVKFGDSFYCETSPIIISSVPTFNARIRDNKLPQSFLESIKHWLMDETHHAVKENQWGNVLESMVNADGIGFTATPIRGDKKGLGSHVDGYYDDMSVTCNTFDLIKAGMLSPYKVYCTGRIDTRGIKRDSDGDFNKKQLYIKTKEADIVGSAVDEYLKHLNGKPVITFCINIEHAKEVAQQFNDRGIPSVAVSSKSSLQERESALKLFEEGRIKNLVNVDLFGEGYDCPAIAGVIMLRPTTSFSLYKQQFGRMLRLADGKAFGVLIDHVGNTQYMMHRFSLKHPHDDPQWTLDRLDDKSFKSEDEYDPIRDLETMTCPECGFFGFVGEDFIDGVCQDCGHKETEGEKVARVRELKIQAGVLVELENSMIDELISKRSDMLKPVKEFANSLSPHFSARYAAINNHATRLSSLDVLRHYIQKWSEWHWNTSGKPGQIIQMDFESQFGVNVLIAQTQTANQMQQLTDRIKTDMRIRQWE